MYGESVSEKTTHIMECSYKIETLLSGTPCFQSPSSVDNGWSIWRFEQLGTKPSQGPRRSIRMGTYPVGGGCLFPMNLTDMLGRACAQSQDFRYSGICIARRTVSIRFLREMLRLADVEFSSSLDFMVLSSCHC